MSDPSSVLICRLSALGDVVLALPVVRALRRHLPGARLEFLARAPYHRILADVAGLDAAHGWDGGPAPLPEAVARRDWDAVLDLSGSGRSRRLLARVRRGRLLRVRKQPLRRFAYVHLRRWGASGRGIVPAVERMLAAAAPLGIDGTDTVPSFGLAPPPPEGPVLLAPGAGRGAKRWPAERFAEVARRLAEEDARDVLVAGTPDERHLLASVAEAAGERGTVWACGDPAELPARVRECSAALTNDSGLLHVAEACGVPVVALFGPTRPELGFAPRGPRSVVAKVEIGCSPCDLHGPERCPRRHHRCLNDLGAEDVLSLVRRRLPRKVAS